MTTMQRTVTPAGSPAWLVTDYDTVRQLLADPRFGLTHPDPPAAPRLSESVVFGRPAPAADTDAADHTRMRRLLSSRFSARRLATYRPRVQELVDSVLDSLAASPQPADFHALVSFPLPALVISDLLGVPPEHREQFRQWSDEAAYMHDLQRSMHGVRALTDYISELVRERLSRPSHDLLSDLVEAHREEPESFTLDKVVSLGMTVLFAGHETTVTAIDCGAVLLAGDPVQRAALADDEKLQASAVEEILRGSLPRARPFVAPGSTDIGGAVPRWAVTEVELGGTVIGKGEMVLLGLAHANADQRFGDQPRFDVARHPNQHLTFGHGPHFCAGAPLARLELQVLFASLAQRFPALRLAVAENELQHREDLLTGGYTSVPVCW